MPVVILLVVVVAGLIAYGVYTYNKKHRDLLAAWAAAEQWTYTARDDSFTRRWSGKPFDAGHSRRAQNILAGSFDGRAAIAFDYQYQETSGAGQNRSESTYKFSVYVLEMPCFLPRVSVGPEGFFSKVGHAVGVHDIQLESEAFNRAYRVTAADEKLAYDLLPARTMEALLAQTGVHLRTEGTSLLCFDTNWLAPARIDARLRLMDAFLANVPSFVWHDHGAPDAGAH